MQPPDSDAPHAGSSDADPGLRRFRIGVAVGAVVVLVAVLVARFDYELTLPGKPPPPPPPDQAALRRMDYENPEIYKGYLERDSSTYGVDRTTPEELAQPFPYEKSEAAQQLAPGGPAIETGMLRVSARVQKLEMQSRQGKSGAEHFIVRIENKRQRPIAYRVQTTFGAGSDDSCSKKGALPHNAVAIPAGGAVERTECFYRAKMVVTVEQIEAMELPPLSYFYVSRLFPPHIGASERTSANHQVPSGQTCTTVPQQTILIGMEKGTVSWRDVIDFYARHRCETYDFPLGYRAITAKGQYKLPVSAAQVASPTR
jgi:hypothetical protein